MNIFSIHTIPSIISFISTLFFIKLMYSFAVSIKLVDKPSDRKKHFGEVPLIGGIAILFGFTVACLTSERSLSQFRPLFLCLLPLIAVGVLDDHGDISYKKRLIIQILTSSLMIYYGKVTILSFGDIFGTGINFQFAKPLMDILTIFCVVGVINALNLIDGIDGLCGGISLVTLSAIVLFIKLTEKTFPISLIIYFVFSLLAFLIINLGLIKNFSPKVFLGDTGTTAIGFFLSYYLIKLSNNEIESDNIFRPITCVWILALPIFDTLNVFIKRILRGNSPFTAGRDHIHHLLLGNKISQHFTLIILITLNLLFVVIGIVSELYNAPEHVMLIILLLTFSIYYIINSALNNRQINCSTTYSER